MKNVWRKHPDMIAAGVIVVLIVIVVGTYVYWSFAHSAHLLTIKNRSGSQLDELTVRIGGTESSKLTVPANSEVEVEIKTMKGLRYEFFQMNGEEELRLGACTPWPQRVDLLVTDVQLESLAPPQFSCEVTGLH